MCGGCVSRVRRVLEGHQAVTTASVNLATETALVRVIIGDLSALKSRSGVLQDISSELTAVRTLNVFVLIQPGTRLPPCSHHLLARLFLVHKSTCIRMTRTCDSSSLLRCERLSCTTGPVSGVQNRK